MIPNSHEGLVLLLLVLSFVGNVHQASHQDDDTHCTITKSTRLVMSSVTNQTGQWISKVSLENTGSQSVTSSEGVLNTDHWKVDIDRSYFGCGAKEHFSAVIPLPPAHASPGYQNFGGIGFYKFHTDPKTWTEAADICEKEGAHLAIINSEREAAVMEEIFASHKSIPNVENPDVAGVGFHDRYIEGEYLTIYDEPLSTTGFVRRTKIFSNHDNCKRNTVCPEEDCGSIKRDGGLYDVSCNLKMAFICEQEL